MHRPLSVLGHGLYCAWSPGVFQAGAPLLSYILRFFPDLFFLPFEAFLEPLGETAPRIIVCSVICDQQGEPVVNSGIGD